MRSNAPSAPSASGPTSTGAGRPSYREQKGWRERVTLLVDQWLHEHPPATDLADVLRCTWRGDLAEMRTPLPDECLDLVWVDDGSMWVSGPETRSWARGYVRTSNAVGVRFRPAVGPPLLGVSASELRDTRVRLEELWSSRAARELSERVAQQPDDRARARVLEAAARALAAQARPVDDLAREVAVGIGRARPSSVGDLARAIGVSQRQIHRRCTAAFGYGPATLTRILRLQRGLQLARSPWRPARLVDLATAAGYSDQQHLAHDVQSIMGTTPTRLLRASPRPIHTRPSRRRPEIIRG